MQVRLRLEAVIGPAEKVNGTVTASAPPLATINDIPGPNTNESSETDTWQDVKELVSIKEGKAIFFLTHSRPIVPTFKNHLIDLHYKLIGCSLYDRSIGFMKCLISQN